MHEPQKFPTPKKHDIIHDYVRKIRKKNFLKKNLKILRRGNYASPPACKGGNPPTKKFVPNLPIFVNYEIHIYVITNNIEKSNDYHILLRKHENMFYNI